MELGFLAFPLVGALAAFGFAVVTDTPTPTPPCGACRQLLWEFAPDAEVLLANLTGDFVQADALAQAIVDWRDPDDIARLAARVFKGRPTVAAMGPLGGLEPIEKMAGRLVA